MSTRSNSPQRCRACRGVLLTAVLLSAAPSALRAQTIATWDGGAGVLDGNFSTAANWTGDATPTGAAGLTINFVGVTTGTAVLTQDLASPLVLNQLLFTRDNNLISSYTVGGGSLLFTGAGAKIAADGAGNATGGLRIQRVDSNIIVGGSEFTLHANTTQSYNTLWINGDISTTASLMTLYLSGTSTTASIGGGIKQAVGQTVGLHKTGTGFWFLRGANEFSGGVTVEAGTLYFTKPESLGGATTYTVGTAATMGTIGFDDFTSPLTLTQAVILTGTGGGVVSESSVVVGSGQAITVTGSISNVNTNAGIYVFRLGGTSTNQNTLNSTLTDGNVAGSKMAFLKDGSGLWVLSPNSHAFTGGVTMNGGVLRVSSTSILNLANNNMQFGWTNSGTYMALETKGEITSSIGLGVGQMRFTHAAGFSAFGGTLDVKLNNDLVDGLATPILWNGNSTSHTAAAGTNFTTTLNLSFNSIYADNVVTFHNALLLATATTGTHVVRVIDNPSSNVDRAFMTGVLSGSGGLAKQSDGHLRLTADNTFNGGIHMQDGTLSGDMDLGLNLSQNNVLFLGLADAHAVLETKGVINASLGTGPGQYQWSPNITGAATATAAGSGGFSAYGGSLDVTLKITGAEVTPPTLVWGQTQYFLTAASTYLGELHFGSIFSDDYVAFHNPMNLGAAVSRTIRVFDNPLSNNDRAIISAPISSTSSTASTMTLQKRGDGRLVLTAASTFSGTLHIVEGSVQLGDGGAVGSWAGPLTVSGVPLPAWLIFNHSTMHDQTAQIYGNANGGVIVEGGAAGGVIYSAPSTYSGTTRINVGTLKLNNAAAVAALSKFEIKATGTLDLNGFNAGAFTLNDGLTGGGGTIINTGSADALLTVTNGTFTGTIKDGPTNKLAITKLTTTSILTLGGDNSYSGGTTLAAGKIVVNSDTALGTGPLKMYASTTLDAGTTDRNLTAAVSFTGNSSIIGSGHVAFNGVGSSVLAASVVTLGNTGNFAVNGLSFPTAAANLTLNSDGAVTITGMTVAAALTTLTLNNTGTKKLNHVQLGADFTLAGTGPIEIAGILSATGGSGAARMLTTTNLGGAAIAGGIDTSPDGAGHVVTLRTYQGPLTVTGAVTGSGGIAVGAGTVALFGTNTHTGGTTITAGTLRVGNYAQQLASSPLRFNGAAATAAILEYTGGGTLSRNLGTAAGEISWVGALSGGFAARGSDAIVSLNGGAQLDWASTPGFVGTSGELQFGSTTADRKVTLANPVSMGSANRTIRVFDNPDSDTDVAVINGVVSGVNYLSKVGTGTLILAGGTSYGIITSISGGVLQFGAGNDVPYTGTVVTLSNGGTVVFDRTNDTLALGVLQASTGHVGNVVKKQSSTLSMTSFATGTVNVFVNEGTFQFGRGANVVSTALASVTVSSGAKFVVSTSASINLSADFSGAGDVFIDPSANTTAANQITILGSLAVNGTTTLGGRLSTHATIKNPIVSIGDGIATGSGAIAGNISLSAANVVLAFNRPDDYTYAGKLTGDGFEVRKLTNSTLTLSGVGGYTAATSIAVGKVVVTGAIGGAGGGVVAVGATLQGINGMAAGNWVVDGTLELGGTGLDTAATLTLGGLTLNGSALHFDLGSPGNSDRIVLTGGAVPTFGGNVNLTFSNLAGFGNGTYSLISGYGAATLSPAQFSQLLYSNTLGIYTLTLHNNPGALMLEVTGGGPTGPFNIAWAGGTGEWNASAANWTGEATTYTDGDSVTFGNISGTTTVTVAAGGVLPGAVVVNNDAAHPYAFVGGAISGTTTLVKQGTGSLTLSGDNTFTGATTVAGGTLQIAGTFASPSISVEGQVLQFNTNATQTIAALISGTGVLQKLGTGTTALTAANTFVGTTSVDAGTLLVDYALGGTIYVNVGGSYLGAGASGSTVVFAGGSGTISGSQTGTTSVNSGTVAVADGGTLAGFVAVDGGLLEIQSGGAVTGSIALTSGTATILSGGSADSSPGITIAAAGVMQVQSGGSIIGAGPITVAGSFTADGNVAAGSTITVQNGGTLKGSGSVGNIIIESGGSLSPGNSVESLTAANLTLSSGANLHFEFKNALGTTPGTDWDLIDLRAAGILDLGDATASSPIKLYVDSWKLDNSEHGGGTGDGPQFNGFDPQGAYEWLFIQVADLGKLAMVPNDDDFSRRFQVIDDFDDAGVFDPLDGNPFSRPTSSLGQGTFRVAWRDGVQGTGLYLTYSAIPEPGSMLLAATAAGAAGWYGRRRRSNRRTSQTGGEIADSTADDSTHFA